MSIARFPSTVDEATFTGHSRSGHADVVRVLLAAKAEVNAKTSEGATALYLASKSGHADVVRALLAAKADVNAKIGNGTTTALTEASQNGHGDVVRLLSNAGADR